MTTIDSPPPPVPGDEVDAFAERVFAAVLGAQQVQAIELGARLGWYDALAAGGALTSGELATATSSNERYAREWLEHQAVCGYVTVEQAAAAPGASAATGCRRRTPPS